MYFFICRDESTMRLVIFLYRCPQHYSALSFVYNALRYAISKDTASAEIKPEGYITLLVLMQDFFRSKQLAPHVSALHGIQA